MAPKKNAAAAATATTSTEKRPVTPTPASAAPKRSPATSTTTVKGGAAASWDVVFQNIYTHYMRETAQRTKLIDVFLAFLVVVGALQFAYCVLAGNYVCGLETTSRLRDLIWTNLLTALNSPSTLSSPASLPPSANSSSPVRCPFHCDLFQEYPNQQLMASVSLRIQTATADKTEFPSVSPERYDCTPAPVYSHVFGTMLTMNGQSLCRFRRLQLDPTLFLHQLYQLNRQPEAMA